MKCSAIFSILVLTILQLRLCHSLYEYVCKEEQLYKPYVHIYEGRHGKRKHELTLNKPGLLEVAEFQNIYVCINGPCYLYFYRTTELGIVYEIPRPFQYVHTCQMYNVAPSPKVTTTASSEILYGILLMGDSVNYKANPALQLFTAPYYYKDKNYYVNATSVVTIGTEICYIEKNGQIIEILPYVETPPKFPTVGKICRLGFSSIKKETTDVKYRLWEAALRNDYALRNAGCGVHALKKLFSGLRDKLEKIKGAEIDPLINEFRKEIEESKTDLAEAKILVKELMDKCNSKPSTADACLAKKQMKDANAAVAKWTLITDILESGNTVVLGTTKMDKIVTETETALKEANVASSLGVTAAKELNDNEYKITLLKTELKLKPLQKTRIEGEISKIKTIIDDATGEMAGSKEKLKMANELAETKKAAYIDILKPFLFDLAKLKRYQYYVDKIRSITASPIQLDVGVDTTVAIILEKIDEDITDPTDPTKHPDALPPATSTKIEMKKQICSTLPKREDQCKAVKPDEEIACSLGMHSLGVATPEWITSKTEKATKDTEEPLFADEWKDEVLNLVESIFSKACFYLPKAFGRNINRIMKFYLTSSDYFNKQSLAMKKERSQAEADAQNKLVQVPPNVEADQAARDELAEKQAKYENRKERDFWTHIKLALNDCNMMNRYLDLRVENGTQGKAFVTKNGTEIQICHFKEQSDEQFTYNYVIDIHFKMMATVMGLCMPDYELKIPLITSRFFSFYTEDVLIPLRDTWVDFKDNHVFEFILGEYYNGDGQFWTENCMEASFIVSDRVLYRPPRSLIVNGGLEHNYFTNGKEFGYAAGEDGC